MNTIKFLITIILLFKKLCLHIGITYSYETVKNVCVYALPFKIKVKNFSKPVYVEKHCLSIKWFTQKTTTFDVYKSKI